MDAWQRETHRNTAALIALAGATYRRARTRVAAVAGLSTSTPGSTTTRWRWPGA